MFPSRLFKYFQNNSTAVTKNQPESLLHLYRIKSIIVLIKVMKVRLKIKCNFWKFKFMNGNASRRTSF